jgi:hypothetical protein
VRAKRLFVILPSSSSRRSNAQSVSSNLKSASPRIDPSISIPHGEFVASSHRPIHPKNSVSGRIVVLRERSRIAPAERLYALSFGRTKGVEPGER